MVFRLRTLMRASVAGASSTCDVATASPSSAMVVEPDAHPQHGCALASTGTRRSWLTHNTTSNSHTAPKAEPRFQVVSQAFGRVARVLQGKTHDVLPCIFRPST